MTHRLRRTMAVFTDNERHGFAVSFSGNFIRGPMTRTQSASHEITFDLLTYYNRRKEIRDLYLHTKCPPNTVGQIHVPTDNDRGTCTSGCLLCVMHSAGDYDLQRCVPPGATRRSDTCICTTIDSRRELFQRHAPASRSRARIRMVRLSRRSVPIAFLLMY